MSGEKEKDEIQKETYWSDESTLTIGNLTITRQGIRYDEKAREELEKYELDNKVYLDH